MSRPAMARAWRGALTVGLTSRVARPLLTTASAIQALAVDDAIAGHPVRLRATVTVHDPAWTVLFVQDDTRGIFVLMRSLEQAMPAVSPGDVVEIVGKAAPGDYAPVVAARRVAVVGHAALPTARAVTLDELLSGREGPERPTYADSGLFSRHPQLLQA